MADVPSPSPWPEPDPSASPDLPSVLVDCDGCAVRGLACDDCVVTVLLGPNTSTRRWDADEVSALDALADAGLVPPLRLVQAPDVPDEGDDMDIALPPDHPL